MHGGDAILCNNKKRIQAAVLTPPLPKLAGMLEGSVVETETLRNSVTQREVLHFVGGGSFTVNFATIMNRIA